MKTVVVSGLRAGINRENILHITRQLGETHWRWWWRCRISEWKYQLPTAALADHVDSIVKHCATCWLTAQWLVQHNQINIIIHYFQQTPKNTHNYPINNRNDTLHCNFIQTIENEMSKWLMAATANYSLCPHFWEGHLFQLYYLTIQFHY